MMEEGELTEDCHTMEAGIILEEGDKNSYFNYMSRKNKSPLNRVNSKLKAEKLNIIFKKESRSNYVVADKEINGVNFMSNEEASSHDRGSSFFKEKSGCYNANQMLNEEMTSWCSLNANHTTKTQHNNSIKVSSKNSLLREERNPSSETQSILKEEMIEATRLSETKTSLTDVSISFFATHQVLEEKEEERENKKEQEQEEEEEEVVEEEEEVVASFEKSFLLLNVTSCCLDNLPGHSVSRKRPDLKPAVRQRAFSSRRRARLGGTGESGDQGPDQSLQVRERPKSSRDISPLPFLEAGEMRMQEAGKALLSKPWSLFLCLLLILPQTAICDIPRCNPENMGDNPFCIPLDYNKVRKVILIE